MVVTVSSRQLDGLLNVAVHVEAWCKLLVKKHTGVGGAVQTGLLCHKFLTIIF